MAYVIRLGLVCSILSAFLAYSAESSSCPPVVSRSQWKARSPKDRSWIGGAVQYAFLHHTAGSHCYTHADCERQMRGIQNYHMDSNGWSDIGYSFLVGEDGRVYEGRGWSIVGAHTAGFNSVGYGISVMGNYMDKLPTKAATDLVQKMIACGVEKGYIVKNYKLRGHRDMKSTLCPGSKLYQLMKTWNNAT